VRHGCRILLRRRRKIRLSAAAVSAVSIRWYLEVPLGPVHGGWSLEMPVAPPRVSFATNRAHGMRAAPAAMR